MIAEQESLFLYPFGIPRCLCPFRRDADARLLIGKPNIHPQEAEGKNMR